MRGFTARNMPYMGLVDRRPVVCRNLAMGFWVPLQYLPSAEVDSGGVAARCACCVAFLHGWRHVRWVLYLFTYLGQHHSASGWG